MELYEYIGGEATIRRIVETFYPKVLAHPSLAPIFPEDIDSLVEKQYQFLTQFFGGPPLYTAEHGNPMMRARHMPFPITPSRAEAWLDCMRITLEEVVPSKETRAIILERLKGPAFFFVNTDEQEGQ
ncbi:globin [Paenibacillus sp. GCM10023248]|uniref:globin domain-containing protein n=1 Tax=Bacillales TaxID=1385 RepID=UPI002378CE3C|nr:MULTISPECIES: globin [Bacillales]MDD9265562.1 globin [Paenibacillus sp. MAHUQ-63]MDR6878799.1 hemoglobin [Bacillus sp. 3255]